MDGGSPGFLVHQIAFQLYPEALVFSFGGLQLQLRVDGGLLRLRITHFQQDRIGFDLRAGQHMNANHGRLGFRRNLTYRFLAGHERPKPPHLAQHRTALDRVGPNRSALNRGRRRLQP